MGVPDLELLIIRDDSSAVEIGSADSVCLKSRLGESDRVGSIPSICFIPKEPRDLVLVCSVSGILCNAPNNCVSTQIETGQSTSTYQVCPHRLDRPTSAAQTIKSLSKDNLTVQVS